MLVFALLCGAASADAGPGPGGQDPTFSQVSDPGHVSTPDRPIVVVETSLGEFEIELRPDRAPATVRNFLRYVDDGYYTDTIFHRVIAGVLVQAGGYDETLRRRPAREPIENEADNGLMNDRWTVAMYRDHDIRGASSEWFVNMGDNQLFNHRGPEPTRYGFAVFGRVVAGRDVLRKIADVPTTMRRPHQKVPVDPVTILSARRKEDARPPG